MRYNETEMKYTIFGVIAILSLAILGFSSQFTGGFVLWYLLLIPLILRFFLYFVFEKLFTTNGDHRKFFNVATVILYILVIILIWYGISHMDFGNSWI